jgi:hypothetical protein
MPRPKRLRVATSAPAPRSSSSFSIVVEIPPLPRDARAEYIDMTNVSDMEAEAVAPAVKRGRGRPPKKRSLPVKDLPSEPLDSTRGSEHIASEALADDSSLGDLGLESSNPSVELGRRDRHSTAFESSVLSITNFKRKPRQPSILGRGPLQARSSSVESNRTDRNGLAGISSRNVSTLSIGNFKRRPRQPSIPGQRARSSSLGLDTGRGTPAQPISVLKLGNFRRRTRESSVLGTSRRPQDQAIGDDNDEDDFNPEDESTPLKLAKDTPAIISSTVMSSNTRKRKLSAAQERQASPKASSSTPVEEYEDIAVAASLNGEAAQEYDIPSSPPEAPIQSIEPFNPDPINETMAPPRSSSSPPERLLDSSPPQVMPRLQSQNYQPRGRRPFRGRTPLAATQDSPISSPPPLTHSPNRPARGGAGITPATRPRERRHAAPPRTFSTAQLQTLLPRRRRPVNRDPYEIDSSEDEVDLAGLASDDDELTNPSVGPQRRRAANTFIRRPAPLRNPGRPRNLSKTRDQSAGVKATYGLRANATSDKENEEYDPDHSLAPLPDNADADASLENNRGIGNVKELKEAAKKFKEVDQWDLEFEEVTASSSSPVGAR